MEFLRSIVLGLVQGLGEFLPISSSGHLIIVPWLFGWPDQGLTFDIALHLGTTAALFLYFRTEIINLGIAFLRILKERNFHGPQEKLVMQIILGSVPGAIMGLLLEKKVETVFRNPIQVAIILVIVGGLLWFFDMKGKKNRSLSSLSYFNALLIGFCQGLAVVPGVSRSGSTITTALALGFTREAAARFSFLLAFPITLGACALKLRHLGASDFTGPFIIGIIVSFISGWLAIDVLLKFVRTKSYGVFSIYRLGVFILVLAVYFLRG